jgi:hypothetical protein
MVSARYWRIGFSCDSRPREAGIAVLLAPVLSAVAGVEPTAVAALVKHALVAPVFRCLGRQAALAVHLAPEIDLAL